MKRRGFLKALGLAGAAVASRKALAKSSEPVAPALDDGLNIDPVLAEPLRDRYWAAKESADWNDPKNWSFFSGGEGGAPVPGEEDNVFFDENGPGDCHCPTGYCVKNFTITSEYPGTFAPVYPWPCVTLDNMNIG